MPRTSLLRSVGTHTQFGRTSGRPANNNAHFSLFPLRLLALRPIAAHTREAAGHIRQPRNLRAESQQSGLLCQNHQRAIQNAFLWPSGTPHTSSYIMQSPCHAIGRRRALWGWVGNYLPCNNLRIADLAEGRALRESVNVWMLPQLNTFRCGRGTNAS